MLKGDSKKSLTSLLSKWINSVGHEGKVEGGDNLLSYRSLNYKNIGGWKCSQSVRPKVS